MACGFRLIPKTGLQKAYVPEAWTLGELEHYLEEPNEVVLSYRLISDTSCLPFVTEKLPELGKFLFD